MSVGRPRDELLPGWLGARNELPRPSLKALHAFDPPGGGRVADARFVRWQAGNWMWVD